MLSQMFGQPLLRSSEAQEARTPPPPPQQQRESHAPIPAHLSSLVPSLVGIKAQILDELEHNVMKLLTLNPSRREAIAQRLDRLAGGGTLAEENPQGGLRAWIEGIKSSSQNKALRCYFEEVALTVLGQALLLKAWSDRGLRSWSETDLGQLNWALSSALKAHLPLDRDGWAITRPNLYSWYNPSPALQREIWANFKSWRFTDEGPGLLTSLLTLSRQHEAEGFEPRGFDSRFFESIWEAVTASEWTMQSNLLPAPAAAAPGLTIRDPMKRKRVVFSPTLRDGAMVRTGPVSINWVGLESSPYLLVLAELVQLWWGPAAPPLWGIGSGLEAHTRDQLSLALSFSKPSLISRIAEMEAADLSFVLEERTTRTQARSVESLVFREQVEALPYFKKLKAPGTTQGMLQTSVALTKLRPGGHLFWARDEGLSPVEGTEALNFILERARILCEWDFSQVEHTLPSAIPLFPKHLYLLAREPEIEKRLTHRPLRIAVQGTLRSHVELPLMLNDAIHSYFRSTHPRGNWKIQVMQSPTSQHDWADRWPNPACPGVMRDLEALRMSSLPLANASTVRATPTAHRGESGWCIHESLKGFWIHAEHGQEGRKLVVSPLPRRGGEASGSGFLVLVPNESWVAPLSAYLESPIVNQWLDHHAERKAERWVLTEQIIKWIPVPKSLMKQLGGVDNPNSFALPLPGDWERIAAELQYRPESVREALERAAAQTGDEQLNDIRASLFVRTSQAIEHLRRERKKLLAMVTPQGKIRWRELLEILPKAELSQVTVHPRIRMNGNLPAHLPVGRIDRIKMPAPGIIFATDAGFSLQIFSDVPLLLDMLWEQLEGMSYPTWNELVGFLRLPRRIEIAEVTATDLLRSHGDHTVRLAELEKLLSACTLL